MPEPFVLGVNYWPRRKAMDWWKRFDRAEVQDEFDLISELGLSRVRVFLMWEDFQPSPERVSTRALDDLIVVADTVADRGLGLDVTFFVGHMSGPNWAPEWLLSRDGPPVPGGLQVISGGQPVGHRYRDPFSDPLALHAERLLLTTVVGAMRDHPGVWLWNLGNEPDLFALPSSAEIGAAWVASMTAAIRDVDQRTPVTVGLHLPSLETDNGLRVDAAFESCDLSVMHAYSVYADWAHGPTDTELVPFVCALTAAMSGKPVLAEEFGAPTAPVGEPTQQMTWEVDGLPRTRTLLAEEDLAAYLERVLPRLVQVGAIGALVWCFADYETSLWNRPPLDRARHERFFGLVRPDGSLKPHAEVLRRFAATAPVVAEPSLPIDLSISGDDYYADPKRNLLRLYREFREALS